LPASRPQNGEKKNERKREGAQGNGGKQTHDLLQKRTTDKSPTRDAGGDDRTVGMLPAHKRRLWSGTEDAKRSSQGSSDLI